jgi:HrpA-like RNA helicase
MYELWVLGALDNTGALTELGRKMGMCRNVDDSVFL